MSDCVFCKIVAGELPCDKVYEDDHVMAFMDIMPSVDGHTLVVPKEHFDNLLDTPVEVVDYMMRAVQKVAPAAMKAVNAQGFNTGINTGPDAGQVVFHTHFHILPRIPGDGKTLWGHRDAREGELPEMAAKIRENL